MFNERYAVGYSLIDLTNGETIESYTPSSENELYMFDSLAKMKLDMMVERTLRQLKDDATVDNIWAGYKVDAGAAAIKATIMYHQYADNETPNYSDPNRQAIFMTDSLTNIKKQLNG